MRIVVIGAASSTLQILKKLIQYCFDIAAVFGQEVKESQKILISDLTDLSSICKKEGLLFLPFNMINSEEHIATIKNIKPDLIFAVGFSQLVSTRILKIPRLGCIGFHPTALPKGRGCAPVAWLVLREKQGAATFFLMGKDADNGPIFAQGFFDVEKDDTAKTINDKIIGSIDIVLDRWLPELKSGVWNPIPQDENQASFYGKRNPLDGWINWNESANNIHSLIRATTKPYPGAYTFYKNNKLIIWKTRLEKDLKIIGVIGRILVVRNNQTLIQTGIGLIWIVEYDVFNVNNEKLDKPILKVGEKLGYNVENEIYKIINRLKK